MIYTLIKINIAAMLSGAFKRNKSRKMKPVTIVLIGLLVVYTVGVLLVSFGAMFYSMCEPLFDAGIGWFYFALAGIVVFALCFIGGIFMVQSQIFSAKDNELLLSMPIRPGAILGGRLAALMIIEYLFAAMIVIPVFVALILAGYLSSIPVIGIIFYFITSLVTPLLAIAFGCLVGWLVTLLSSRIRRKNIPTLIISIALLAAYFWLYSGMMGNMNALVENGAEIADAVRRAVFPAYHLGMAVAEGNFFSFLIFILCAVFPFIIMYAILSMTFIKLATGARGAKKVEYREKSLRVSGAFQALVKRELLHFWSQPMYILNAAMGVIVTIILAAVMAVRPGLLLDQFDPELGVFAGLIDPGAVGAIILTALATMNFVSAPSISLEGKRLWIAKSLPVHSRDILLSKAGMHVAICGLSTLLAGIVCMIVIPMNAAQVALTLILPLMATLMFAQLGVVLNLAFPRFDWINPIQPVKQGMSGMLSMFGGMAMLVALVVVYVLIPGGAVSLELYMALCAALFAGASAGLYAYLTGAGARKFEAL